MQAQSQFASGAGRSSVADAQAWSRLPAPFAAVAKDCDSLRDRLCPTRPETVVEAPTYDTPRRSDLAAEPAFVGRNLDLAVNGYLCFGRRWPDQRTAALERESHAPHPDCIRVRSRAVRLQRLRRRH